MFVIAVPLHTDWLSVPAADVSVSVPPAPRATEPLSVIGPHGLVAVTVYVPAAVGVPVIVRTPPATLLVNPAGRPVTVTPVAVPPIVYDMFVIAVPLHTDWLSVPAADVSVSVPPAPRATEPLSVIGPHGLVAVTVYVPAAVGVPVIVRTPPATLLVNPAGNPATVIPVAVPPIV